jgi:hypothetical protein
MMRRMFRLRRAMSVGMGPMGRKVQVFSGLTGRVFRGAPLIAWFAAWAVNDLCRPDSRIKAFARRLTGKAGAEQCLVVSVEPAAALGRPDVQNRQNGSDT